MFLQLRKKIALITTIAASLLLTVAPLSAANATGTDDLAWIGTSSAISGGDGLLTKYSGAATPTAAVPAPLGYSLATDNTSLYFIRSGNLVKSNLDGSGITNVLANLGAQSPALSNILGMTISGTNLYLIDGTSGVFRIALSNSAITKINNGGVSLNGVTQSLSAQLIVATSTTVYWGESDGLHSWTIGGTPGTEGTVKPSSDFDTISGITITGYVYSLAQQADALAITVINGSGLAYLFQKSVAGTWSYTSQLASVMYAAGLAMSPTNIYYTDFGGSVFSLDRSGANAATVFSYSNDSEAIVYITPSVTPPAPAPAPVDPELANTGSDIASQIALTGALFIAGLFFSLASANRRRA